MSWQKLATTIKSIYILSKTDLPGVVGVGSYFRIGWTFKNQVILTWPKVLLSIITIVVTTVGIVVVNKKILQKIDELEEL
jgi:hypothetical protein